MSTIHFDEVREPVDVKFSHEKPEIYALLEKEFGIDWEQGIVITYGDTVYSKVDLSPDLIEHESVHVRQQLKMGVTEWWRRYVEYPEFRFAQELEAYQVQYAFLAATVKDREQLFRERMRLARDLSSSIYGNIVSYNVADRLISKK